MQLFTLALSVNWLAAALQNFTFKWFDLKPSTTE